MQPSTHVKDASTPDPESDATQKAAPVVTGGRDDAVPAEARGSFPKNPASVYTVDVTTVGSIGMAHVPGTECFTSIFPINSPNISPEALLLFPSYFCAG